MIKIKALVHLSRKMDIAALKQGKCHKTRCGIPLIELGPLEVSVFDEEITCEDCKKAAP